MKLIKKIHIHQLDDERRGDLVKRGIIAVAAVVFAAFYLIGFNVPWEDNPQYNEPLLTDLVIVLMWLTLAGALGVAVWSVARIIRSRRTSSGKDFGVPVRKVALGVTGLTVVVMLLSFLLADTSPIRINGHQYSDALWLRMAGMFVFSCLVLLVAAVIAVIVVMVKSGRKERDDVF